MNTEQMIELVLEGHDPVDVVDEAESPKIKLRKAQHLPHIRQLSMTEPKHLPAKFAKISKGKPMRARAGRQRRR